MTDRDVLRDEIERMCVIDRMVCKERGQSIEVIGGPKYMFTAEGELKSIISSNDGKSFDADGERIYKRKAGG